MASDTEKALRLLCYLKKYTDVCNPTSMPLIDYYFQNKGYPDFFGTPNSKRRNKRELIKKLARILNTDIDGNPLPKEEWVIVYDGYGEESTKDREFICNLYYNQPFSKHDVEDILKSIENNANLKDERRKALIGKVSRYAANKNYLSSSNAVKRGMNPIDKKKFLINKELFQAWMEERLRQKRHEHEDYYDW